MNRLRASSLAVLVLVFFLVSVSQGIGVVTTYDWFAPTPGPHDVEFIDAVYDPATNVSTFTYEVTCGGSPAISHWVIGGAFTEDDIVQVSESYEFHPAHHPDPPTGQAGLKFEEGYLEGQMRTVWFQLEGVWSIAPVPAAMKGGQMVWEGMIYGPGYKAHALTISVSPIGGGSTAPAIGSYLFPVNSVVSLSALESKGYEFSHWVGDVDDSDSSQTAIIMDDDYSVTAVFTETTVPETYTLTMSVSGNGTVSPGTGVYDAGETVSIEADAADGWEFSHWAGDDVADSYSDETEIVMNDDKSITAVFTEIAVPETYTLTITVLGCGDVTVEQSPLSEEMSQGVRVLTYLAGTSVDLQATSTSDECSFVGWSGDLSGSSQAATVAMNSDKTISAQFVTQKDECFSLDTAVIGNGSITVDPARSTEGCYSEGTEVEATATPAAGWKFVSWQGDVTGIGNSATVVMRKDQSITAVFERIPVMDTSYDLRIEVQGEGSVNPVPGVYSYRSGQVVTVTAAAADGWYISEWSGDAMGNSTSIQVTMNGYKMVRIVFAKEQDTTIPLTPPEAGPSDPEPDDVEEEDIEQQDEEQDKEQEETLIQQVEPQAGDLPKTGGVNAYLGYLSVLLIGLGLFIRRTVRA